MAELQDIQRELEKQTGYIDQTRANTGELEFQPLMLNVIIVLLSLILWRVW